MNNLPKVVMQICLDVNRTHNLLIASSTSYRYATVSRARAYADNDHILHCMVGHQLTRFETILNVNHLVSSSQNDLEQAEQLVFKGPN